MRNLYILSLAPLVYLRPLTKRSCIDMYMSTLKHDIARIVSTCTLPWHPNTISLSLAQQARNIKASVPTYKPPVNALSHRHGHAKKEVAEQVAVDAVLPRLLRTRQPRLLPHVARHLQVLLVVKVQVSQAICRDGQVNPKGARAWCVAPADAGEDGSVKGGDEVVLYANACYPVRQRVLQGRLRAPGWRGWSACGWRLGGGAWRRHPSRCIGDWQQGCSKHQEWGMLHTCNAARQWQGHAHEHGSKEHRAWGMAAWGMAGAVQRMAGQSRAEHLDCREKKDCVARASGDASRGGQRRFFCARVAKLTKFRSATS